MLMYNFHKAGSDACVIRMTRTKYGRREAGDEEPGDVLNGADQRIVAV